MSQENKWYVAQRDVNLEGENGVTAQFYAGKPRQLRESLVAKAIEAGVIETDGPEADVEVAEESEVKLVVESEEAEAAAEAEAAPAPKPAPKKRAPRKKAAEPSEAE